MVAPAVAMGLIGLGQSGMQYIVGEHKARQAKRARHKYRDILGLLLATMAKEDEDRLREAFGEAEEKYRGAARARGSYRPELFAAKKAELGTDLQKALQRSRLGFAGQFLTGYAGQPAPVSPTFDITPALTGAAMGMMMPGQTDQRMPPAPDYSQRAGPFRPTAGQMAPMPTRFQNIFKQMPTGGF